MSKSKRVIIWEKFIYPDEKDDDVEEDFSFSNENVMSMKTFIPKHAKFNFWVAHTNFTLSLGLHEKILEVEKLDGVEALKIISRYRFMVAFGKSPSFDADKIKLEITKVLCSE